MSRVMVVGMVVRMVTAISAIRHLSCSVNFDPLYFIFRYVDALLVDAACL